MKRTGLLCLLLSAVLAISPSMSVLATQDVSGENQRTKENSVISTGYVPLNDGYVPDVTDTDYDFEDTEKKMSRVGGSLSENSVYVPVDEDYIPSGFEDQGVYNTCWAISAVTACVINANKKGLDTLGMSASHLAYYFYNLDEDVTDPLGNEGGDYARMTNSQSDWTMYGGNGRLAMWELASWIGVAGYNDTSSPYHYDNFSSTLELDNSTDSVYQDDTVHVQNVYMSGIDETHRDNVKTLIKELGAVTAGYYADTEYDSFYKGLSYDDGYDASYGSYYYDGTGNKSANHAVAIIGWDDNYDKNNFVKVPASDGAWLVLNSWGEESSSLAQNGYFWLSYEDAGLLQEGVVIGYDVESADNYDNIYQYDGSFGVKTQNGKRFVQFFQLAHEEQIKAVSIGTADADVSYTASVYAFDSPLSASDIEDADLWLANVLDGSSYSNGTYEISCSLLCQESGTFSYEGYHTVNFSDTEMESVEEGTTVAVVFEFENSVNVYSDMEYIESSAWDFQTGSDTYRGVVLTDSACTVLGDGSVLRLKMFTDNSIEGEPYFSLDEEAISVDLKDTSKTLYYTLSNVLDPDSYRIEFAQDTTEYLFVGAANGKIIPSKVGGPTTITASLYDEKGNLVLTDTCKITITSALEEIRLSDSTLFMGLGDKETLGYTLVPDTAVTSQVPVWTSSDDTVATVNENGEIEAVGYGEAVITCEIDGISAECAVTVSPQYTGVVLDKNTVEVKKGNSVRLTATVLPEDNKDIVDFTWSSSDETVATVDEEGKVTGVSYGEAEITVTCGTFTDTCKVTVTGQLTGVAINKDTTAILKGGTVQLVAQAYPEDTTDEVSFTWSSNNTSIAVVDENGKVTGTGYGEAEITVTCGVFTDTCKVIVTGQLAAVVLNKSSLLMKKGDVTALTATLEPEELAEDQVITWSSSNGKVATVDENGNVTAIGEGRCTITVTCGGFSDTCEVTVDSLKICKDGAVVTGITVSKDNTASLSAVWGIQDGKPVVNWKSNNTGIAKVDGNGVVTGISEGTTMIYAMTGDGMFTKGVSVRVTGESSEPDKPDVTTVNVDVTNASAVREMVVGQTVALNVTYETDSLTDASVRYSSSDSSIVSVSGTGVVVARKEGSAKITVTVEGKEGNGQQVIPVTVKVSSGTGEDEDNENTSYSIVISNINEVKKIEVGKKVKVTTAVTGVSENTIPDAVISCEADGVYVGTDSDGNLVGLKAGTGILVVTAVVDGETVKEQFYITVIPSTGNTNNSADEDKETGTTVNPGTTSEDSKGNQTESSAGTEAGQEKVHVTKIVLDADTRQISIKGKLQISATVKPSNAENKKLKWYSSNKKWATVTQSGLVKAKKAGAGHSVIITCRAADGSGTVASYFVRITKNRVTKIKLTTNKTVTKKVKNESGEVVKKKVTKKVSKKITVKAGKSLKLNVAITTNGKDVNKKIVWTSSNKKWATVSSKGKVKTKKAGKGHTVTITAKTVDGSKKGTFKVKIK